MKRESEAVIQQGIHQGFNNKYCLKHHKPRLIIHSVPNGLAFAADLLSPEQYARILDALKKTGMVSGIADLNIKGVLGRYVEVEVKTSTGTQSEDQKDIEIRTIALGGRYILVRSINDFWLKINPNLNWLLGNE